MTIIKVIILCGKWQQWNHPLIFFPLHVFCRSHSFIDGRLKDARNMMGLVIMTLSLSRGFENTYAGRRQKKKGEKSKEFRWTASCQSSFLLSGKLFSRGFQQDIARFNKDLQRNVNFANHAKTFGFSQLFFFTEEISLALDVLWGRVNSISMLQKRGNAIILIRNCSYNQCAGGRGGEGLEGYKDFVGFCEM